MTVTATPTKPDAVTAFILEQIVREATPLSTSDLAAIAVDAGVSSARTAERRIAALAAEGRIVAKASGARKFWTLSTEPLSTEPIQTAQVEPAKPVAPSLHLDPERTVQAMANAVRTAADPRRGAPAGLARIGSTVYIALEHTAGDQLYARLAQEVAELAAWSGLPLALVPAAAVVEPALDALFSDVIRQQSRPHWLLAYQHRLTVSPGLRCFDEAVLERTSPLRAALEAKLQPVGLRLADESDGATA
jgi:hypothetical protein